MKVLFITNIPSPYRVCFFRELGKLCELTVLYERHTAEDRNSKWVAEQGLTTYQEIFLSGVKNRKDNAFCPDVKKYLNKNRYDIIIVGVYSTPTGMYAIQYMKRRKIPYFISCDGGFIKEDHFLKYRIKKYFLSGAQGYFSSATMTDDYLIHYGADSQKIYRYSFTSLASEDILEQIPSREEKREARNRLGMTEDRIFLSVGQFIYRKGYDLLLHAASVLPETTGIYIVGGEPTEEYLRIKSQLNLSHVHFIDFQEKKKLKDYFIAADVFVLPTREDIWGLVVNEAMAHALPVVTTNKCVAGVELVAKNGKIIETDSVKALENALLEYSRKPNEKLKAEAKKSLEIIKNYTFEQMAKEHIDICCRHKPCKKGKRII